MTEAAPVGLVEETHPLLSTVLEPYKFGEAAMEPVELANLLGTLMLKYGGLGLSANQLGLPYRCFVMRTAPEITAVFNPRIVDQSDETALLEEGCLSYPGLHVKIKRPAHIKVRFQTVTGETVTDKYTGLTARVFLHELDHLEGKNFIDRAGKLAKDVAMRKWKKLAKVNNLKRKFGYGN